MEPEKKADPSFDWAQLTPGEAAPGGTVESHLRHVDHLLSSGLSADVVWDRLVAAGLPEDYVASLLAEAHRRRKEVPGPNGPGDMGTLRLVNSVGRDVEQHFDRIRQEDMERRERLKQRKERREKVLKRAPSEPDPTFAVEGDQSYARLAAERARKGERGRWFFTILVIVLVFLPLLLIAAAILLDRF